MIIEDSTIGSQGQNFGRKHCMHCSVVVYTHTA